MSEISVGGKLYEVHSLQGRVAAATKHLETRVHGGGGGGYTHQGSGYTAPVTVSSTTVTHDQIFVIEPNGREHALRLENWNISTREGHELVAVWLIKKGKASGPYVVIQNRTLNETQYNDQELEKLCRPSWLYPLGGMLAGWVVLGSFSGFLGFVATIGSWGYWWYLGRSGRQRLKSSGELLALPAAAVSA
jgi:hypothetical protein